MQKRKLFAIALIFLLFSFLAFHNVRSAEVFSDGQAGSTQETAHDFSAWTGTNTAGDATASVGSIVAHHGSYSFEFGKIDDSWSDIAIAYEQVASDTEYYIRSYVQIDSKPSTSSFYFMGVGLHGWSAGASDAIADVIFNPNTNKWGVYGPLPGWTAIYESGTSTVNADEWYCVELHIVVHGSAGVIQLWVDEAAKLDLTSQDTDANSNIQYALVGCVYLYNDYGAEQTLYVDCVVVADAYIGAETEAGAENLSLTLNSPVNDSVVAEYAQTITYTPIIVGSSSFQNSSLYVNNTLVASNATTIQNATANTISYTFPSNGTYVWDVQVWNSTNAVFSTNGNFTLSVQVVELSEDDFFVLALLAVMVSCVVTGVLVYAKKEGKKYG